MATLNPLEQKARISFIKGILIAGLIGAIGIGLLVWQLTVRDKTIKDEQGKITSGVLVLAHDVSSGQLLSEDDFTTISALKSTLPTNYYSSTADLDLGKLQDKEGNDIYTKYDKEGNAKLYIKKDQFSIHVKQYI